MYAGHGDWSANTHGGAIISADLTAETIEFETEHTFPAECVWTVRRFGDRLFVPNIDPQFDTVSFSVRASDGTWSDRPLPADCVHLFDVVQQGPMVYAFGARLATVSDGQVSLASVWRSTDDGLTWALSSPSATSMSQGTSRCYGAAILDGQILSANDGPRLWRRPTGGPWSLVGQSPGHVDEAVPFMIDGTTVAVGWSTKRYGRAEPTPVVVLTLPADDTQRPTIQALFTRSAIDITTSPDGALLYVLEGSGKIRQYEQDGTATLLGSPDVPAVSLAAADDVLYLGTADASVRTLAL